MAVRSSHYIPRQAGQLIKRLMDFIEAVHNAREIIPELLGVVDTSERT